VLLKVNQQKLKQVISFRKEDKKDKREKEII